MPNRGAASRLFATENLLYWLLVFFPVALVFDRLVHASALWVFVTSALAIIPLAGAMGRATEQIAERAGEGIGGLLNATFGNAAELIIAIVALRAGLYNLVKASITGSIIGNVLLVFGLSALLGGLKYPKQSFNRTAAGMGSTLLALSAVGLVIPAIFHALVGDGTRVIREELNLSLEIAIVLMATYLLSLVFTLGTHRHLYVGDAAVAAEAGEAARVGSITPTRTSAEPAQDAHPSMARAIGLLLAATAGVAVMAHLLVGAAEVTARALGWNEVFVGVILVAIIGNAAEHSTAVLMALKNRMDAAINIAVGSSIQVALFVAPLLLFLSYFIGPRPLDLIFTTLEVFAVAISVGVIALIAQDGESHWMEGVQLLAVYVILGIAFFFLPV
jgi:Ca2+:H+ antiporter